MTQEALAVLQKQLAEFVLPYTETRLGEDGSTFEIEARDETLLVKVTLGFPAAKTAADLVELLQRHCDGLNLEIPLRFEVESAIRSHSVQSGLKPLDGISNLIAVASGK